MNLALKTIETRAYPSERELVEKRNNLLIQMEQMIERHKREKREFSANEQYKFDTLKKQASDLNEQLSQLGTSRGEMRTIKTATGNGRTKAPYEVRGYRRNERIGNNSSDVTIGDLIYSHVTGRYRNEEVRQALSTTTGGLSVPVEVFEDFVDALRNESFLGETTVYPMNSQTLIIPRVSKDPEPHFKLENEPIVEDSPIFEGVVLQAKPLYCMASMSLELVESSNLDMGQVINRILIGAMQNSMQNFMIFGAVNGYEGIINDVNINKVTATAPIGYTDIGSGIQAIRGSNGQPNALIGTSDTLMGLELATDTTGQFITPPQFFQDLNKFALNGPDLGEDVILADLSAIAWGVLSEGGLQIEIDKFGDAFSRGQIRVRARINGDFKVTNPKLVAHVDVPTI